jgi:hypothetical protein
MAWLGLEIVRKSLFYKGNLLFQLADHVGHWTYRLRSTDTSNFAVSAYDTRLILRYPDT